MDCEAGHSVLFESKRWNEEAMNDIDRAQGEIDFAVDRQVHGAGDDVIFGGCVGSVEANGGLIASRRVYELRVRLAVLAVRSGIAEIPGELHAGDFDGNGAGLRRFKALARPDMASHQVEANKEDGSEGGPGDLHVGIAVGVLDGGIGSALAMLPDQPSQGTLGGYEHDAHNDVGQSKLMIDPRCSGGNPMRQPPGFCNEEIGA